MPPAAQGHPDARPPLLRRRSGRESRDRARGSLDYVGLRPCPAAAPEGVLAAVTGHGPRGSIVRWVAQVGRWLHPPPPQTARPAIAGLTAAAPRSAGIAVWCAEKVLYYSCFGSLCYSRLLVIVLSVSSPRASRCPPIRVNCAVNKL